MKSAHITFVLLLAVVLCGCQSAQLYSTSDTKLAPLQEEWLDADIKTKIYPTEIDDGPEVGVAVHEIGEPSDRCFVKLHGVNSDHGGFRFLVPALGAQHNFILVDLPGCGESDCLNPRALGPGGYSPDALAERVLQALDAHLARREQMPQITLVGHSLGGTIAIRMMASPSLRERYDRVLRHVDRMVLLAPADVEIDNPSPTLVKLAAVSGLEIAIARLFGILESEIAKATIESVFTPELALQEEADKTCDNLERDAKRLALQAMLIQTSPRLPNGTLDRSVVMPLVDEYKNVDVPCLIIWGRYDETLPMEMGCKLARQIPTAELYVLDNCKHSMQLEFPDRCADLIVAFTASALNWRQDPSLTWLTTTVADGQTAALVSTASEG